MPRSKEGKKRTKPLLENLQQARNAVLNGVSQRSAAEQFRVSRATLKRYMSQETNEEGSYQSYEKCAVKKIFERHEEDDLCKYLVGLHIHQLRTLAY